MKNYTVILLYPYYIKDRVWNNVATAWVQAKTPKAAVKRARQLSKSMVIKTLFLDKDDVDVDDFALGAVFEGHATECTPEE